MDSNGCPPSCLCGGLVLLIVPAFALIGLVVRRPRRGCGPCRARRGDPRVAIPARAHPPSAPRGAADPYQAPERVVPVH